MLRILGAWAAESPRDASAQIDLTFTSATVEGLVLDMDLRDEAWSVLESIESLTPGHEIVLIGCFHDSSKKESQSFLLVKGESPPLSLVVYTSRHLNPATESAGSPALWNVELALGRTRNEDRLRLTPPQPQLPLSLKRVPANEQEWTEELSDGYRLVNRVDVAPRYHAAVEARLEKVADGTPPVIISAWNGLHASGGALSPDLKSAAVTLSPFAGWGMPGMAHVVNLNDKTMKQRGPLFISRGALSTISSAIAEPLVFWADGERIIFTDTVDPEDEDKMGVLFTQWIIIKGYDTGTQEGFEFKDPSTMDTVRITPGLRHEFIRDASGRLYFAAVNDRLYPIDLDKRTIGPAISIPAELRSKNTAVMLRELTEKTGAWLEKAKGAVEISK